MCGVNALVSLSVFKITKTRCHALREETWRILLQMIYSNKLETTKSRQKAKRKYRILSGFDTKLLGSQLISIFLGWISQQSN